jgi:uncharacterized MAPEG superfamily protein
MGVLAALNDALPNLLVIYAVCTSLLYFVFKFSTFYCVNANERPPEDAALAKLPVPEPAEYKRRVRLLGNNIENVLIDLSLFWAAFVAVLALSIAGGGKQEALALSVLLPVYTAARLAFTVAYARAIQPLRSLAFSAALACVVAVAGVLLSSAAKAYTL